jgi:hypothetical protein
LIGTIRKRQFDDWTFALTPNPSLQGEGLQRWILSLPLLLPREKELGRKYDRYGKSL